MPSRERGASREETMLLTGSAKAKGRRRSSGDVQYWPPCPACFRNLSSSVDVRGCVVLTGTCGSGCLEQFGLP